MKLSTIAAFAVLAATSAAAPVNSPEKRGYWAGDNYVGYSKDVDLNCRTCPSTECNSVAKLAYQSPIEMICQTEGQNISGDTIWALTTKGCYVSDDRIQTYLLYIPGLPKCPADAAATPGTDPSATPAGDASPTDGADDSATTGADPSATTSAGSP